jgi:hypothetical protein
MNTLGGRGGRMYTYVLPVEPASYSCSDKLKKKEGKGGVTFPGNWHAMCKHTN